MVAANIPSRHWLTDYVNSCGSKNMAAKRLGIPRRTLRRWLEEIETAGETHSTSERMHNVKGSIQRESGSAGDAFNLFDPDTGRTVRLPDVFNLQRDGRGDDMTCASFPGNLGGGGGYSQVEGSATSGPSTTRSTNTEPVWRPIGENVRGSRIADGKAAKRRTVLFLYDIHLPNHSEENIALALDYAQSRHKIDTVVIGGDFLDCAGISRWKKDPYGTMPLHEEIARGVAWLEELRGRFPGAEIVILKGNHEDRLQNYLWNQAAEISKLKGLKLQDQLELDRLRVRYVDNLDRVQRGEGVYSIGKLNILHGHELGICPNVNPARQYFLRALDNIICGHVHKVDEFFARSVAGKTMGAWVCGPLCDMTPEYRPLNPWVAGFALAHFDDDGLFSVKLKKVIEGRVL